MWPKYVTIEWQNISVEHLTNETSLYIVCILGNTYATLSPRRFSTLRTLLFINNILVYTKTWLPKYIADLSQKNDASVPMVREWRLLPLRKIHYSCEPYICVITCAWIIRALTQRFTSVNKEWKRMKNLKLFIIYRILKRDLRNLKTILHFRCGLYLYSFFLDLEKE